MTWQVLDWNIPAIDFYKKFDAEISKDWLNGKLTKKQIENIGQIITSASKIFDKYVDVKVAIKGALQSYKTHANHLQSIVTKSWGTQGLEKQINKLKDEHGVIPGKPITEIPVEQSTVSNVDDPEQDPEQLN